MEIPGYQPFYIDSVDSLRGEIDRLGLEITVDEEVHPLAQTLVLGSRRLPNRFCAQPIMGGDAARNGAPGPLTLRRYRRYADGNFAMIWVERTVAGAEAGPGRLRLHDDTVAAFGEMVRQLRTAAPEDPAIILQVASENVDLLLHAATLAADAGFDGVDLQCPREALPEAVLRVREGCPDLLVATRLCVYEATRNGFGVAANDYRRPDMREPIRLVQELRARGLSLLNVTTASPALRGSERGVRGRSDAENPDEHPLMTLHRQLRLAHALRAAVLGLPVVGSGFSWLRQFVPHVAAWALREGLIDFAGLGRGALANPHLPKQVFAAGGLPADSACMVCFACSQLRDEGEPVGCVLRDPETYGPIYRQMRRFDADQLLAGAARCHLCEAAPCVAASPMRTDIPAFIQAFRNGDEARAYEIIRARDPLPELTSRLSPAWLESEGACIETTLTGTPVPILDLQYAIAWRARDRGQTGVRIPTAASENASTDQPRLSTIHHPRSTSVAIVGGGPTGLAAAIRLLELGHTVHLYEQSERLGGVAELVLSLHRSMTSPREEIEAILAPALAADRLRLHFGITLGKDLRLETLLRANHAAVVVAPGLWQERSLGHAPGVVGALEFLESPECFVPERVAILSGGDSAMDAARAVQSRGAKEIFIVFGGPRSAMHWHLPESWFATPGVQAMMHWQPLGYETGLDGRVCAVRVRHLELQTEAALPVDLVIEAMELQVSDHVKAALAEVPASPPAGVESPTRLYQAGALVNGGASVGRCVAEGLAVAESIHRDIAS